MDQGERRKDAVVLCQKPLLVPYVKPQTRRLDLVFMPSFDDDDEIVTEGQLANTSSIETELVQQLETNSARMSRVKLQQMLKQLVKQKLSSLPKTSSAIPPVVDSSSVSLVGSS